MNCRECEPLLVEIARRGPGTEGRMEAGATVALEHAATCPVCAERLGDERAVTAGLRRLALAEKASAPSTGCEAALMAAYRTERGREVHTRRWIFAVSGAMAASLAVLLGAALMLSSESSSLVRSMTSKFAPQVAQHNPEASGTGRAVSSQTPSGAAAENGQEEVTEFMAYYPGADLNTLDGGALVRVRVPSSELTAFGLPVGPGNEDQWVSADLLVGEDGSPQAIRFVRTAPQPAASQATASQD